MEYFKYLTYDEYNKFISKLLYKLIKHNNMEIEDFKQEIFIFIINLEEKISKDEKKLKNIKGYILTSIRNYIYKLLKNNIKNKEKLKLYDLGNFNHIEDKDFIGLENRIYNKIYLNNILNLCKLSEDEKNVLFEIKNVGKYKFNNTKNKFKRNLKKIKETGGLN